MREMKDSGIEWIGQIPKDWDKGHLKYYTQIKTGGTPSTSNQVWFDGDVLWFTPGDFDNILLNDSKRKLSNLAVLFRVANLFPANTTMIVGIGGTAGKVGYTIKESYCNQQITALINKSNTYPKYITYLMFCFSDVLKDNALYTTLPILNNQFIGDFSICIPKKLSEQRKITDYLDTQCSEIDATAEDIQKEISLLEDYKKSVITEAVTKGLNPDAEMKDSGIEWIGEIPKDWELLKIGYVTKEISDIDHYMPSDSDDIDKVPYLMIGDLKENISQIDFESCKYISKKVYRALSIKSKPEKENVIFARYATIGTVCFVDSEKQLLVSYACLTVKANELIKGRFLFYYFKSNAFLEEVSQYVKSNTQGNIGKESLIRAKIVVPKLKEQTQIISYLDSKCSEIDTLIADKKRQLDILADYKKSLIYEYVTGKKEVPVNE